MARIAGVNIPTQKRVVIALQYIHGIGPKFAKDICAKVGIPDTRLGEVGMAFVVTRSGDPAVGAEILAWSRGEIANYKVPRAIEIVDELPVNATGKVEKNVLRERAARARPVSAS